MLQGSVIGPLFFIIYINDLSAGGCLPSNLLLLADDSKCFNRISSTVDCLILQEKINDFIRWSDEWDLKFNVGKISRMISKKGHISLPYYVMLDHVIPLSNTARDLGVHFSADLSWSHHISIIMANAYKMLGLLKRSLTCNVLSVRKRLYISLVWSQLSYGSQVWWPSHTVNLEKIQRRASKYVLSDYTSTYKDHLIEFGLLPLVMYLEYLDFSFLLRCLTDAGSDNFNINSFVSFTTLSTRAASNYKLPQCFAIHSSHFYLHRLPCLWNMLPTFNHSLLHDPLYQA